MSDARLVEADLTRVVDLDRFLGDPETSQSRLTSDRTLERDSRAELPAEAIAALDEWGVQRYYIPRQHGGLLDDVLVPLLLLRTVARRDVTAAVAHGKTFLGSVCAWAAADGSANRMAEIVAAGDPVSWGLTEQGRGSDVASSATSANLGDEIVVDGHKWPIGNATRGRAITVLARTSDKPGPRALSLVLVDKHRVDPASISYRPRRALHGIRGADISGIEFSGTRTSSEDLVGEAGRGLELVLKSLQVTRTMCAALSLGAGDQALQLALSDRAAIGADAVSRAQLATSTADLLLAEAVACASLRQLHSAPDEMSLVSAFAKVLVPDAVDLMCRELGGALGARSQLASGRLARFQKATRDGRVVSIFDGNSVVNLNVVINEFANIARPAEVDVSQLVADAAISRGPSLFDMSALRLITRRGSRLLRALPALAAMIDNGRTHPEAVAAAAMLAGELAHVMRDVAEAERTARPPVEQFVVAERLTLLFGAASSLVVYLANRDLASTAVWSDDLWLRAALARLAQRLGLESAPSVPMGLFDVAFDATQAGAPVSLIAGWWHDDRQPND